MLNQQRKFNRQQILKRYIILLTIIYFILFTGCSRKRINTIGFEKVDAPSWVIKGSGAFKDGKDRVFYGIGAASMIKNYSLLRLASENRARNEVAKVFEAYTASLMRDYAASTTVDDLGSLSEEQHVEQAIKVVVSITLSGVEIIDHWEYPTKGIIFSLARIDLDEFDQGLENMTELNSKVKDFVRKNAERLHEELVKHSPNTLSAKRKV